MLEELVVPPLGEEASVGEGAALLAYHWLRAEEWEKALDYTLEAAERAQKLFARPEAINHYWQALELMERLPHTPERGRVHCDVILSLARLPGSMRDDEAEARLFRHVDQALTSATEAGQTANMARLEAIKGRYQDDEALLESAIARAESSGDRLAEAFAAGHYGAYLGLHGQFEASLDHIARAIEIWGEQGEQLRQARTMASGGTLFQCPSRQARSGARFRRPCARGRRCPQQCPAAGLVRDGGRALFLQRALGRSRLGCRGGITGCVGDRRVGRGVLLLRWLAIAYVEAGTAGQSPARPRSCLQ